MTDPTVIDAEHLAQLARDARGRAYAPYSRFQVGAALLTRGGAVHLGVNVENAAYPVGICAERCALGTAVAAGDRDLVAIAVVGGVELVYPCGMCRQALTEFCPDIRVILVTTDPAVPAVEVSLRTLLPHAFGPDDLAGGQLSPTRR